MSKLLVKFMKKWFFQIYYYNKWNFWVICCKFYFKDKGFALCAFVNFFTPMTCWQGLWIVIICSAVVFGRCSQVKSLKSFHCMCESNVYFCCRDCTMYNEHFMRIVYHSFRGETGNRDSTLYICYKVLLLERIKPPSNAIIILNSYCPAFNYKPVYF